MYARIRVGSGYFYYGLIRKWSGLDSGFIMYSVRIHKSFKAISARIKQANDFAGRRHHIEDPLCLLLLYGSFLYDKST